MHKLGLALLSFTLLAQEQPARYALELHGEPLADTLRETGPSLAVHYQSAVAAHRAALRWTQRQVARDVEARGARVRDRLEITANVLMVEVDSTDADWLADLPGVARIHRLTRAEPELDRGAALTNTPAAWTRIGGSDRAGYGVKVAVLDTGVDNSIPALQDPTLPMPEGFPRVNRPEHLSYTNSKVIVARSYGHLTPGAKDNTPGGDFNSHGTETSSCVAAVTTVAPLSTLSGIAPKSYIGNYKVIPDDSDVFDSVYRGYEDAVADGMDVISMSLHTYVMTLRPSQDLMYAMAQRAAQLGVVTVRSTGNEGPLPATITNPPLGQFGILVGNAANDRQFAGSFQFNGSWYKALPGDGPNGTVPISGPVYDVGSLDGDGLACLALPANSLRGYIALIQRGTCNFSVKLANALDAGAIAALVYTDSRNVTTMSVAGVRLPAAMLERAAGLAIKQVLSQTPNRSGTLDFNLSAFMVDARNINGSSSRGPGPENEILPDLVAVGTEVYMPQPGGIYGTASGTSFSAPQVSGAVALLKSARPGLSLPAYRSLIINSATPFVLADGTRAGVMVSGAGMMNVDAALQSKLIAYPTSVSFGAGGGTVNISRPILVQHLGAQPDTWQVVVEPHDSKTAPTVSIGSLRLNPNQTGRVTVLMNGSGLAPGEYQGFILFRSASGAPDVRVPYWYGVTSGRAEIVAIPKSTTEGQAGSTLSAAFYVRITDNYGIRQPSIRPTVTVQSGGGTVTGLTNYDTIIPGIWMVSVRLGPTAGNNVFEVQAGGVTNTVTIVGK